MSLFSTPEEHAANGPETWRIVRHGRNFALVTKDITDEMVQRGGIPTLAIFRLKRDAVAALEPHVHSWIIQAYEKEGRWYAGETIRGWKSWAECKAERERTEARMADLGKPAEPYDFEHNGHTYRLKLPARFLTEQTDSRDYYVKLLTTRLERGHIGAGETAGNLAGAYGWERVA